MESVLSESSTAKSTVEVAARASDELELSIVMPCLNEARTIGTCVNKARAFLDQHAIAGEIVVADNGSSDGSREIAAALGARVITVPDRGYGSALRAGIEAAGGTFAIMGDSDDSYDFTALAPFVRELRNGYDIVLGNRFAGGIAPHAMPPLHRYFGNPLLTTIGRTLYGGPSRDFYCGLRGFRRHAVLALDLNTPGMEFALEMIVKGTIHKLRMTEVPTTLSPDGRLRPPHLRSWRDGWRSLRFFLLLCPRVLFLYPGLGIFLFGVVATMLLLVTPVRIGTITFAQHTLVVMSAAIVIGFQAIEFWFFAKIVAMRRGLLLYDSAFERLRSFITLERGLIIGGSLAGAGAVAILAAFGYWTSIGFGRIEFATFEKDDALRLVCGGSTTMVVGLQIIYGSFFLYLLDYATAGRPSNEAKFG